MFAQHPHTAEVQGYRPLAELVPAHWQSGTVTTPDGATIYYTRTGGIKPVVLLLHGVQVNGLMWLRTAKALEATYDVMMPDFRGHGKSSRVEPGMASDTLVNDTIALIKALGLNNPFVIGHSMGAEIAGRLAAVYPVHRVVLVDPALQNFMTAIPLNTDEPPPWMIPIYQAMEALRTQSHQERMVTGLTLLPPGTPLWSEADYVSFVEAQAEFDMAFFRYAVSTGYLFEAPDVIAKIDCSMLLLTARPMMPSANIDAGIAAFKNNWRNGQHIHFEDSGHFIPFDQFERFITVVTGFLGSKGKSSDYAL